MTALAILVRMLAHATVARRVLVIGVDAAETMLASVDALPQDGLAIAIERDPATAAVVREKLRAATHADRASVMIGDPARFLHKVAGPFDLIVNSGDPHTREAIHERVVRLLGPEGTLVTPNSSEAGRYNEILTADRRLQTATVNIAGGVAISVRQRIPS